MTGEGIQNSLLPEGPGRRLREARTALKLSRDDVARALRLKPEIIHALEADDATALPAPIYVNGYLRNYARLLGIPAEPLIEAYAQLEVEAPTVISEIVKPADRRQTRRVVRGVSLLVVAAVLAGFLSWLQNQDIDWLGNTGEPEQMTAGSETVASAADAEQLAPVLAVPVDESGPEPAEVPELPVEEQTGQPTLPATGIVEDSESGVAIEKQQVSDEAGPEPVPQMQHIVLHVEADCWVEITGAKGRRLVYDLVRAGQTREVHGIAPLKVFLGNATGVRMEVNGQDYDFSQHISGKLARFTLTIDEDA